MADIPAPSWPSLYNPGLEILHIEHRNATQYGGAYLHYARDVFQFTLFWTLALYTPTFIICGTYAFWNLNFPPSPSPKESYNGAGAPSYPMNALSSPRSKVGASRRRTTRPPKENERRSRLAFALLVLFTFLCLSVAGAVVGSTVIGLAVFGLYKSANFNMSTWIPFLLAVMQVLTGLLSLWPSIIDII